MVNETSVIKEYLNSSEGSEVLRKLREEVNNNPGKTIRELADSNPKFLFAWNLLKKSL